MTIEASAIADAPRPVVRSMARGALQRCPQCGRGRLFRAYLKVEDTCGRCGEAMHHQRADDAPPYVTIFVVGHLIVAGAVGVDMAYEWPIWLHAAVWLPLTVGLCLTLLPIVKGALIGLQWALRMHGFASTDAEAVPEAPAFAAV